MIPSRPRNRGVPSLEGCPTPSASLWASSSVCKRRGGGLSLLCLGPALPEEIERQAQRQEKESQPGVSRLAHRGVQAEERRHHHENPRHPGIAERAVGPRQVGLLAAQDEDGGGGGPVENPQSENRVGEEPVESVGRLPEDENEHAGEDTLEQQRLGGRAGGSEE